ncbi:MAG TPA: serine/threonine protein phosphatase [Candidatus Cloacimonetes bacterium]|nr:serine/threonine protein phosphatase [Candidatus Cloacimonadota bacterium]
MKEKDYSRLIAVGDIHGQFDMLQELMGKIIPSDKDFFVFIGDYIDRGKKSREVVDYLINFKKEYKSVFLRGNHEDMLLDLLGLDEKAIYGSYYEHNGGEFTAVSYGDAGSIVSDLGHLMPQEHLDFIQKTKIFFETDRYYFAHGGVMPGVPFDEQKREVLIWIRYQFINYPTGLDKIVVFGHSPQRRVLITEDKIGIDTGAGYFKKLSAIDLFTKEIFQVSYR